MSNTLMSKFLKLSVLLGIQYFTSAFVYLGGAFSTKLPATPESPVIKFYWNGEAPEITGREEFEGGIYKDLSDYDLTKIIFQQAMGQWTSVRGSYLIYELVEGPTSLDPDDKQNSIPFTYTCDRTQATHPSFSDDQKFIDDCDIEICVKTVDAHWFMSSMAHELGHCAGLGHPDVNYASIMSYSNMGRSARVELDDIAGLTSLYPDPAYGDTKLKNIVACGTIHGGTKHVSTTLLLTLFAMPLMAYLLTIARGHGRKLR